MRWILVTYRLPTDASRARVAVWREIRRSGALHLQQSVVAFPDAPEFRADVERLRQLINRYGGSTLVVRADPLSKDEDNELVSRWNAERDNEHDELAAHYEKLLGEIERRAVTESAEADFDDVLAEFDELEGRHTRLRGRDVYEARNARTSAAAQARVKAALGRAAKATAKHRNTE